MLNEFETTSAERERLGLLFVAFCRLADKYEIGRFKDTSDLLGNAASIELIYRHIVSTKLWFRDTCEGNANKFWRVQFEGKSRYSYLLPCPVTEHEFSGVEGFDAPAFRFGPADISECLPAILTRDESDLPWRIPERGFGRLCVTIKNKGPSGFSAGQQGQSPPGPVSRIDADEVGLAYVALCIEVQIDPTRCNLEYFLVGFGRLLNRKDLYLKPIAFEALQSHSPCYVEVSSDDKVNSAQTASAWLLTWGEPDAPVEVGLVLPMVCTPLAFGNSRHAFEGWSEMAESPLTITELIPGDAMSVRGPNGPGKWLVKSLGNIQGLTGFLQSVGEAYLLFRASCPHPFVRDADFQQALENNPNEGIAQATVRPMKFEPDRGGQVPSRQYLSEAGVNRGEFWLIESKLYEGRGFVVPAFYHFRSYTARLSTLFSAESEPAAANDGDRLLRWREHWFELNGQSLLTNLSTIRPAVAIARRTEAKNVEVPDHARGRLGVVPEILPPPASAILCKRRNELRVLNKAYVGLCRSATEWRRENDLLSYQLRCDYPESQMHFAIWEGLENGFRMVENSVRDSSDSLYWLVDLGPSATRWYTLPIPSVLLAGGEDYPNTESFVIKGGHLRTPNNLKWFRPCQVASPYSHHRKVARLLLNGTLSFKP